MFGCERSASGAWTSASAIVVTTLAVLGPDALGGSGPLERPVWGLRLLDGSAVSQVGALAALFLMVVVVAQLGDADHRISLVAAAVSATLAQPLLHLLDVQAAAASAQLDPTNGWLAGVAVAVFYSLVAVGLLAGVATIRSTIRSLMATVLQSLLLLVTFFARPEPFSLQLPCPPPTPVAVTANARTATISRRGPPRSAALASL